MLNIFDESNLVDWEGERLLPTNANLDTSVNHIIRYQFAKKIMKGKCLDVLVELDMELIFYLKTITQM